jgi:hemoglobin-like flavoprotein
MTPEQMAHVRRTFAVIRPSLAGTAAIFYLRLFQLEPLLRPMFLRDIRAEGRGFMQMLRTAVANLGGIGGLDRHLHEFGRRCALQGLRPMDYDVIGAALLWTLAQELGSQFTPPVRDAWATAYRVFARTMQDMPAAHADPNARAAA